MVINGLDFKYVLLDSYKKMNISEDELVVILMVDHLLECGEKFITADVLSLKMNLPVATIDKTLVALINRNFLEYDFSSSEATTNLNPLRGKLYRNFEIELRREQEAKMNKKYEETVSNIYSIFEKEFGRPLSPLEFSKIHEWVSFGYTDDAIVSALKEAVTKGKKTIRSIDKILLGYAKRNDIEKEGFTTLDENHLEGTSKVIQKSAEQWKK